MHTGTGDTYDLGGEEESLRRKLFEQLDGEKQAEILSKVEKPSPELERARRDLRINTAPIVPVAEEVVQKLRLGERELRRRKQRRR
jgi:hypothetical protein